MCVPLPAGAGAGAAAWAKLGVEAATAAVAGKRKFRGRIFKFPSLSWLRRGADRASPAQSH
jgi:hypothetical protein